MSLVHETRKVTVESISKQLEYITKGHIATQTILLKDIHISSVKASCT